MATTTDPATRTGAVQGDLWSERSADWADGMEPFMRPVFEAALDAVPVHEGDARARRGLRRRPVPALAAGRYAYVAGLDAAPGMLASRASGADARIEQGDIEELPFADASFDVVAGFNSFQYAATPGAALAEAHRVLRPGGKLFAAVWSPAEMCGLAGYLAALGSQLPAPPPGAPGPVRALRGRRPRGAARLGRLRAAGDPRRRLPVRVPRRGGGAALAALGGPARPRHPPRGLRGAVRGPVLGSIEPFRGTDGAYRIDSAFRFTTATR